MIQQFEQYKNLEHSVLKNIIEVANEFSDLVSEDIHIQSTPQNDLLQKLATIFSQAMPSHQRVPAVRFDRITSYNVCYTKLLRQ